MNNSLRVINFFRCLLFFSALFLSSQNVFANWTLNLGYQNPAVSTLGINFLYMGSQWCFEIGIGYADFDSEDKDASKTTDENEKDKSTSVRLGGDVDMKYLFSGQTFKPYVQAGVSAGAGGTVGDKSDVSAGAGGGFVGGGIFAGSTSFYGYVSLNASNGGSFVQGGFGFDI